MQRQVEEIDALIEEFNSDSGVLDLIRGDKHMLEGEGGRYCLLLSSKASSMLQ